MTTLKYCLTLAELADHAEANHALVKSLKAEIKRLKYTLPA